MPAPCCTGDSWVCCGCNWKSKITDAKCQQCVDYWRCSCGCVTNRILREKCEECQGPRPFSIPSSSPRGQASGSRPMDPSPVKLVRPPMSGNAPPAPLLGDCEAATEIASQLGALFTGQQKPPESALNDWISIPSPRGPVKSSEIRLVRVGHGQGLAFFPWGNHRQIRHPEWGEECSSMFRHRGSAGDHSFTLEPGDIFIMCPRKCPWPVCVWCCKFLFPCDAHRRSNRHGPNAQQQLERLRNRDNIDCLRKAMSSDIIAKHMRVSNLASVRYVVQPQRYAEVHPWLFTYVSVVVLSCFLVIWFSEFRHVFIILSFHVAPMCPGASVVSELH